MHTMCIEIDSATYAEPMQQWTGHVHACHILYLAQAQCIDKATWPESLIIFATFQARTHTKPPEKGIKEAFVHTCIQQDGFLLVE